MLISKSPCLLIYLDCFLDMRTFVCYGGAGDGGVGGDEERVGHFTKYRG